MAAPFILKLRLALGIEPEEAAELLHISVKEYLTLENDPKKHFYTNQAKNAYELDDAEDEW
ncbi:hypothetical protein N180_06460 [Pedobacter antarcticus 4BY]|uniref:HTH cro/C1-type domain-containing protein n=2 Tax=Pedobacter antarcticus TaxID=34086 RepID=A0A081PHJ5_9SPHI|nr:hypothetical protein [Pedobacter antarcticus]KEQ30168.1 hypothetical protein N180_06460 [Pedobacter antarcticus 4BY]SFE50406.1 hypothetical protein SAMN03003324_00706 [Pedobacter antarcticus]